MSWWRPMPILQNIEDRIEENRIGMQVATMNGAGYGGSEEHQFASRSAWWILLKIAYVGTIGFVLVDAVLTSIAWFFRQLDDDYHPINLCSVA